MQPSIPWSSSVSVFVIERTAIIHSWKCTVPFSFVVPLLSLVVTHCHLLSLVITCCITHCHFLSFVVPLVVTRCHLLPLVVPIIDTRCTTRCHSWSFVATLCHSMYHSSVFYEPIYFFNQTRHPLNQIKEHRFLYLWTYLLL